MSDSVFKNIKKGRLEAPRHTRGRLKGKYIKVRPKVAKKSVQNTVRLSQDPDEQGCTSNTLLEGREVMEPKLLAEEMWCSKCKDALSFQFATEKQQRGLAAIYTIKCHKCSAFKRVHTNNCFGPNSSFFSINAKAAMGVLDAGIGESQLNTLLCMMNIAPVPSNLLKRYERIIGPSIEQVAQISCRHSLEEEISLTRDNNDIVEDETGEGKIGLTFSYDVGWQKRGTGRSYNSLSGHGVLMGYYTKKIVSYAVRSKRCRKCAAGHDKSDHDCRKNYNGSSKGMEADIGKQLYISNPLFETYNVFGARLIMDNDSSTIAGLRTLSRRSITLWADKNHTVKAFANSLYGLSLPKALIEYFTTKLSSIIAENRGNPDVIEEKMKGMVPHAFGDHSSCNFHSKKENYLYKTLPNCKQLQSTEVKAALEDLIRRYAQNVEKIAPAASTQANESFNNTVASFCPKSKHFSGSESINFRIAAAVCHKNIGNDYANDVFKNSNLSPMRKGTRYRRIQREKMFRRKIIASSRSGKLRRKIIKQNRAKENSNLQKREGLTYHSNMLLSGVLDVPMDTMASLSANRMSDETERIHHYKIVYVDTETTGFGKEDEICQIAAYGCGKTYNVYILPNVPIRAKASAITGIIIRNGDMFCHGRKVETVSSETALKSFIIYLNKIRSQDKCNQPCKIILVGHNIIGFDAKRIAKLASQHAMYNVWKDIVFGYSDTLSLFKKIMPDRKKNKLSFSQEALVKHLLPAENTENLHNALADVQLLMKLVKALNISEEHLRTECKSIRHLDLLETSKELFLRNRKTLLPLSNVISRAIICRMARQGINLETIIQAYKCNPKEGLKILLCVSINKKARVTASKEIVNVIRNKIEEICNLSSE